MAYTARTFPGCRWVRATAPMPRVSNDSPEGTSLSRAGANTRVAISSSWVSATTIACAAGARGKCRGARRWEAPGGRGGGGGGGARSLEARLNPKFRLRLYRSLEARLNPKFRLRLYRSLEARLNPKFRLKF